MAAMELRPYQREAIEAIQEEWNRGVRTTLLVLPTGCGKTIVFCKLAQGLVRQGERVLILAHRGELLDQAADKMKKATEVPKGLQNVVEMLIDFLDGMIKGTMGKHAKVFRNYIGTIAIFILVSNISGLIGLRPPTADYGVTFPMGVTTFLIVHFLEFKHHKPLELWAAKCSPLPPWLPVWLPVTLIGDFAVPISLSLRLFANVLSGTVMMSLIYGLLRYLAVGWPAALHVYFDIFSGAIQTYVFCMLTMTYITDAYGDET